MVWHALKLLPVKHGASNHQSSLRIFTSTFPALAQDARTCDEGHCKELEELLPGHRLKAAHTLGTLHSSSSDSSRGTAAW
jgi:hypothetical protein